MLETKLELDVLMMEMKRFKAFVLSAAEKAGLSELQTSRLRLVVEEAVANVINYSGAKKIELNAWEEGDSLYWSITDDGAPFNPTQYAAPDLNVPGEQRQVGGLGIHYIRKMSDSVAYRREDGEKTCSLY